MKTYRVYDGSDADKLHFHKTNKPIQVGSQFNIDDGKRLFFVTAVERDEADESEFPDVLRGTSTSLA